MSKWSKWIARTVKPAGSRQVRSVDAVEAARAALSGRAQGIGQDRGRQRGSDPGVCWSRTAPHVTCGSRPQNQIRHLGRSAAPDELRERFRARSSHGRLARSRSVASQTRTATRSCSPPSARRGSWADGCSPSTTSWQRSTSPRRARHRATAAPSLLDRLRRRRRHRRHLAGRRRRQRRRHPLRSGVARTCAASRRSSLVGQDRPRHRLNRGGNRQANHALWRIVFTRMSSRPRTRAYVARRIDEGAHQTRDHPRASSATSPARSTAHLPDADPDLSGGSGPSNAPTPPAVLANDLPARHSPPRARPPGLIRACPQPEWPITGLPAPPEPPLDNP